MMTLNSHVAIISPQGTPSGRPWMRGLVKDLDESKGKVLVDFFEPVQEPPRWVDRDRLVEL